MKLLDHSTCKASFAIIAIAGLSAVLGNTPPAHAQIDKVTASGSFKMKRCVNMGNALEAPGDAPWGRLYGEADYERIAQAGFDTVRIPVRWSDHTADGPDYAIDASFAAVVDQNIEWALSNDLNIVLNIHHFNDLTDDPVANFAKYRALWAQLSERYSSLPDNVWFEVLNEPHKNLKGRQMRQIQSDGLEAIRRHNPDRVVILGGEDWSGINSLNSNLATDDPNVVYTFHYYDPFNFTHQKATWLGDTMPQGERDWGSGEDRAQLARDVEKATSFRERVGRPVFLGEFGVNAPVDNDERVKWARAVKETMEEAQIPWCLWSYGNTFELYASETGWDDDMLNAITSDPE